MARTRALLFLRRSLDAQQELAAAFQIRSIPTLMAFRENVLVFAQPGAMMGPQFDELVSAVRGLDMEDVHAQVAAEQAKAEAGEAQAS